LEVKKDEIYSIAASDDRSLFLWSTLTVDNTFETTLNLPSLSKLSNLLDVIGGSEAIFTVASNHIQYRG
jgi:hypothetical protein